nr:nucleotidyltransferase family protein [Thiospirillum jenense]
MLLPHLFGAARRRCCPRDAHLNQVHQLSVQTRHARQAASVLLNALRQPHGLPKLSLEDWDLLLRVARRSRLLGRIAADLSQQNLLDQLPPSVVNHLQAAQQLVSHRQTVLSWELNRLRWALADLNPPLILLKGIAYHHAQLPPARGRNFVDVDLLVPPAWIAPVEQRLLERGWVQPKLSRYDDHYYRAWMHEIPPLRHRERDNEVDLHHNIVPLTTRQPPEAALLLSNSVAVADLSAEAPPLPVRILAPTDMVLHSLAHLWFDAQPDEGLRLRDLVDAADLMRYFGHEAEFWTQLPQRAVALHLERPLFYGLRYAQRLLYLSAPAATCRAVAKFAPSYPVLRVMDILVPLALMPEHPDFPRHRAALARWLLYIRAHWLRMPPLLTLRHLLYKSWARLVQQVKPKTPV